MEMEMLEEKEEDIDDDGDGDDDDGRKGGILMMMMMMLEEEEEDFVLPGAPPKSRRGMCSMIPPSLVGTCRTPPSPLPPPCHFAWLLYHPPAADQSSSTLSCSSLTSETIMICVKPLIRVEPDGEDTNLMQQETEGDV
eukprot:767048-Hanusia_phi.AAC.13